MKKNTDLENTLSVIGDITWKIIKFFFKVAMWFLWLFFVIFIGTFCMAFGIKIPEFNKPTRPNYRNREADIEKFKREFPNLTLEEFIKEFGDSLEELEKNNQLTPQQQKVIRKVKRVSPSEIRSRIRDVLTEQEEIEVLLLLILQLLDILR